MSFLSAILFLFLFSSGVSIGNASTRTYVIRVKDSHPVDVLLLSLPITAHRIHYVYHTVFHGFSASLTASQAENLTSHPSVLSVIEAGKGVKFQTTRTPYFLGLDSEEITEASSPWNMSDYGSDVIIGMVDTGIWPERRSFRDFGLSPVPEWWKGECVQTKDFNKSACNRKIIGAKFFLKGDAKSVQSPRDYLGHGTHTSATAAGAMVDGASYLGLGKGRASGMAPKARLAMYKVSLFDFDILAAIDEAVKDGVDIISLSLGSTSPCEFDKNVLAIGTFAATAKGVFVSVAAGNDGPKLSSVENFAPWMTTVGASTIDRSFTTNLVLADGRVFKGKPISCGKGMMRGKYLIIDGLTAGQKNFSSSIRAQCIDSSLDPALTRGKIVLCEYTRQIFLDRLLVQAAFVYQAGGVGIVVTDVPQTESHTLLQFPIPGLALSNSISSREIREYLKSNPHPTATIKGCKTEYGVKPAPVIAEFSSRGPNPKSIYSLKPDLVAPGLDIISAWTSDSENVEFQVASGTSVSTPLISGIAALIKAVHPKWSPAAIRSALMTTTYRRGNDGNAITDLKGDPANIWAMGAGHVNPQKAIYPGLVYNQSVDDYLDFLCAIGYGSKQIEIVTHRRVDCSKKFTVPWNLNQPGIVAAFDPSTSGSEYEMVIERAVTNVQESASSYNATLSPFHKALVTVEPRTLEFKAVGETKRFEIRVRVSTTQLRKVQGNFEFGQLVWRDGQNEVYSPVAVGWWKDKAISSVCN